MIKREYSLDEKIQQLKRKSCNEFKRATAFYNKAIALDKRKSEIISQQQRVIDNIRKEVSY